ncbi:MAG: hypothetical protein KF795_12360 [Labilithrix sp.]|nr:hypothetical protein [Labilithrix sp.]
MRKSFGWIVVTFAVVVACGSDASDSSPSPADADAGMDAGGGGGPDDAGADARPDVAAPPDADGAPPRGVQIQSKEWDLMPEQEVTACYHFATPNAETLPINKWKGVMTPGVRSMEVYIGGSNQPPGTLTAACPTIAGASVSNSPVWVFTANAAASELAFPTDDGTGKALAFELPAEARGYVSMHLVNPTAQPLKAHVTLLAEALPEGAAYTKTAPFITYDDAIQIPPFATNHLESGTCDTLPDTHFWAMTMRTHKQGTRMTVKNGAAIDSNVAYESTTHASPTQKTWPKPFFTFDENKLRFECTYTNMTNRTISAGESRATDETCRARGYYFPATKDVSCYCLAAGCVNF